MQADRQRWNWAVDALLFSGFLIAMWLDLTGLAVHQWLGLAMAGLAVYHLAVHRQWVAAVTGRILGGRTRWAALRNWAVDAGLAAGFVAITATGVMMSTWLGLELAGYAAWRTAHVVVSVVTLALVVVKIALHWRWIVSVAQRAVFPARPREVVGTGAVLQPVVVPANKGVGRRQFLSMMTAVGAVSLLAGAHALADNGQSASAADLSTQAGNALTGADGVSSVSNSASRTCTVACRRQCSYPGQCRRYTDSNNNGRCDLGECVSGSNTAGSATGSQAYDGGAPTGRPGRRSRG